MFAPIIRRNSLAVGAAAVLASCHPGHQAFAADILWRDQRVSVRTGPASPAAAHAGGARAGERRAYRFTNESDGRRTQRSVLEAAGEPYLRSGNTMFDGLFALALADMELDRVSQIRDDSFEEGRPIDCVCFETGEKWPYVWTRDISYSVDLGLAAIEPQRALNSLLFKTSAVRAAVLSERLEPATVVAQDTGSGGSWPVSTDRVVWILAADDVLDYLPAKERSSAAAKVYEIARDTVEQDRRFAFDPYTGLYRGETSFLDWREQSYPEWTRDDVAFIASGYAFSTNVLHAIALGRTAQLGLASRDPLAARYLQWAEDLRRAINARFWQPQTGLYASYLSAEPNSVGSSSYDLLGLSLAIVHGVADEERARSVLQHYPSSAAGPPVLWPEQPGIAIYHNRAIWPFVTSYALRAAKTVKHAQLAAELVRSLVRGSALSLSNMENFEFLTQQVRLEDGPLSGPVINSKRQLWSVAGYLSMVLDTLWGLEVHEGRLSIQPWIPAGLGTELFGGRRSVSLLDYRVGGRVFNVTLEMPPATASTGWLEPRSISVNGEPLDAFTVGLKNLRPGVVNEVRVKMRTVRGTLQAAAKIFPGDFREHTSGRRAVFAPPSPLAPSVMREPDGATLTWQGVEPGTSVQIYRNGRQLTADWAADRYVDRSPGKGTVCYSLTQRFDATGLTSLPSRETCLLDSVLITASPPASSGLMSNDGAALRISRGVASYTDWGLPSQELRATFKPWESGWYRFQLQYANTNGPINTGITAAVKTVAARCGSEAEQFGSVAMPHRGEAASWGFSTGFFFKAAGNDACVLRIGDGFNMSYLTHFARYTGGRGGASGALNRADVAAARIDLIGAVSPPR